MIGGLVRNFGLDSGARVTAGEIDALANGAVISSANIIGGVVAATSGGLVSGNVLQGGKIDVFSGALASGNTISFGQEVVMSGGVARGETVAGLGAAAGAAEQGAIVESSYALNGGIIVAQSGGLASANIASGFSEIQTISGGIASGNTFYDTAKAVASTGGLVSGNVFQGSAQAHTSSGGLVQENILNDNSMVIASGGGIISANTLFNSAQTLVLSGGVARNDILIGSSVLGVVSSGGAAYREVLSGAELDAVGVGAVVSGTQVLSGGILVATSSGLLSGNIISSGQLQTTYGGQARGDVFSSGANLDVNVSGLATSETLLSGASGTVEFSGAVLASSMIASGAVVTVFNGGTLSATSVQGLSILQENTTASGNSIAGEEDLYGNASVSSETVLSGGYLVGVGTGNTVTGTTVSDGTLVVASGSSMVSGNTISGTNAQFIIGQSGSVPFTNLGGTVSAVGNTIEGGAQEQIRGTGVASGDTVQNGSVDVIGSADHMVLEDSLVCVEYGGTLTNTDITSGSVLQIFDSGTTTLKNDTIDIGARLQSWANSTEPSQFTVSGNTLTISDQGGQNIQTLTINGTPDQLLQVALIDGSTGLFELEEGTPCYCRGTLIDTDRGEVPVEHLKIGDQVRTLRHGFRPIRWIGRRAYSGQFAAGNRDVLPVVFRAGSLGKNLPRQDLSVSPLHAMYLEGVLVPAVALVNGRSIVQAKAMDEVAYFHIELESHDVIFANGAQSETFVDDGSRSMFHNAADYARLYPDAVQEPVIYYAPRIEEGARLDAIRKTLNVLAGRKTLGTGPLEGYLDSVTRTRLAGWARNPETRKPVRLQVLDRGVVLGEVLADQPRADLGRACGFVFDVPGGLSPLERHVLEVRRVEDHVALANTPWMLDQADIQGTHAVIVPRPSTPLKGYVDTVSRDRLTGWAFSPATPDVPVALQVLDNGQLVASVVANALRPDVRNAGASPTEQCGFDVLFPAMLSPFTRHVLEVRREQDGAMLGKPHVIDPVGAFDPALEDVVSRAVASVSDKGDQDHILSFLLGQVEKLSQARAQADSGQSERDIQGLRKRRGLASAAVPPRRRVLMIDSQRPDTGRDAGSHAVMSHMQAFQALGYEVSFVAADQMTGDTSLKGAPGVKMLTGPVYHSVEDVLRRQAGSFDVVYLHRAENATRYLALVRMHQKKARVVYNVADLHFLRLMRQAEVQQRPEVLVRAQRMKLAEYASMLQADVVLTHSVTEAEQIRADVPQANVHVVPWSVPARARVPGFAKRSGVVFLGNYAHTPNADAARWLVEEIMPRVWKQDRSISCLLAGAEMSDSIHALARRGVETLGQVEDLDALFDSVRLSVAPLRFGAGIKGKVLDSFAAGVPCVMTPVAAEGLMLPKGLSGLVQESAEDLAHQVLRLHKWPATHASMSRAGRAFLREGWTEDLVQQALAAALQPVSHGMKVLVG
ncbi:Hint domain-containing protein [Acetobacter farinalis]|uniref:Hint domain-containing protein n=1 Tax=Acetobacter farinalis TaxID=1260984 RepID=A0ABT3Q8E5_9PROT|nr:Hint domain-containing protein [Acetobacter farinalis]NHO30050.1 glycosyltransferase [Acetobacter farinalis]